MPRPSTALLVFSAAACINSACAPAYRMYAGTPSGIRAVRIWLQQDAGLPSEATREACEFWKPEGVQCSIVQDVKQASIRISLDPRPCTSRSNGSFAVAHSTNDGTIGLYTDCMRMRGGSPMDPDTYRATIAHEIGHQLGIWCHIPADQGGALMNPLIHEELHGITVLDHEAYVMRDQLVRRDPDQICVPRSQK